VVGGWAGYGQLTTRPQMLCYRSDVLQHKKRVYLYMAMHSQG
jgi:hypothetical protein